METLMTKTIGTEEYGNVILSVVPSVKPQLNYKEPLDLIIEFTWNGAKVKLTMAELEKADKDEFFKELDDSPKTTERVIQIVDSVIKSILEQ